MSMRLLALALILGILGGAVAAVAVPEQTTRKRTAEPPRDVAAGESAAEHERAAARRSRLRGDGIAHVHWSPPHGISTPSTRVAVERSAT